MSVRTLCATLLAAVGVWFGTIAPAQAEDTFYIKPLRQLEITRGKLPQQFTTGNNFYYHSPLRKALAYSRLTGEGEIYLVFDSYSRDKTLPMEPYIAVRTSDPRAVQGKLFLPGESSGTLIPVEFTIPAAEGKPGRQTSFLWAKKAHFERLQNVNLPGAAWFQYQRLAADKALGNEAQLNQPEVVGDRFDSSRLQGTFDLLSGGRAVSENLQLDRALPSTRPQGATIELKTLRGIDIKEFDWAPHVKDIKPDLDPLAGRIPHDQHAVFFQSMSGLMQMLSEAARGTAPIFAATPQTESVLTNDFYPRQLCLPLQQGGDGLGKLVKTVAVTGGDPYFALGTDLAVLMESDQPEQLAKALLGYVGSVRDQTPGVKDIQGKVGGLNYAGARSPDRSICCYIATLENAVVVTNSPKQLERLAAVKAETSLASLPEYRFFRNRYPRGENETAFLVISDATIRRWCGPQWRIAQSRRLRAAAVMANLQAKHLDALVRGNATPKDIEPAYWVPEANQFALTPTGILSDVYGDLRFMTPVSELEFTQVTEQEAEFYNRWREGYQFNWSRFFDPIAIQFRLQPEKVSADLTVMPLIEGSEYNQILSLVRGAKLLPGEGDPHKEALLQVALSLNTKSELFNYTGIPVGGVNFNLMSWLGDGLTVYADQSPFWEEFGNAKDPMMFLQTNYHRMPVAIQVEVRDSMVLSAFLTGIRAAAMQAAPGMTEWVVKEHQKRPYVMVAPTPLAQRGQDQLRDVRIFYAVSGESLVVSLSEDVLKHALERQEARHEAKTKGKPLSEDRPHLGENVNVYVDKSVLFFADVTEGGSRQQGLQETAWRAIPILNEWKLRYPDQDPVKLHEKHWGVQLGRAVGKGYRWNEPWQTMESVVYGHPGEPRKGPNLAELLSEYEFGNFGLTFENDGVRAKMVLGRTLSKTGTNSPK